MSAKKIADRVFSVGVNDPNLAVFDIYMETKRGTSYNSYLVKGKDKIALIDGVKENFTDEHFSNIEEVTPLDSIDYLIVNHNEPDHSGSIPALLERNPGIKLHCSMAGIPFLKNILNREVELNGMKDSSTLDLGGKTLVFHPMPYMHWPDTMMQYLREDKILFSNDGFAAHHSLDDKLYVDELDPEVMEIEFWFYFDAIMRPFTGYMRKNLPKLDNYDISIIAPSHGPLYRHDARKYINQYKQWSVDKSQGKNLVTIFYASNYGNTKKMADIIGDNLRKADLTVELINVEKPDEGRIKEAIEASRAILFGTPTFNGDAVKPIWDAIHLLSSVYTKEKKGAAFGSYGWGGEGAKLVHERLSGMRLNMFEKPFRARLVPSAEEVEGLGDFSRRVAEFILAE